MGAATSEWRSWPRCLPTDTTRSCSRGDRAVPRARDGSPAGRRPAREVDGADAVVNLAGVSIGGPRWTRSRKAAILGSRVDTTKALRPGDRRRRGAAGRLRHRVRASTTTARAGKQSSTRPRRPATRSSRASAWNGRRRPAGGASARRRPHCTRRRAGRAGDQADGAALSAVRRRARRRRPPVVPVDSPRRSRRRLPPRDRGRAGGPGQRRRARAAPPARSGNDFGAVLHRPAVVPTPAAAVRLLLGEEADLVLHGQHAVSRKLAGLEFRYRGLRAALQHALGAS